MIRQQIKPAILAFIILSIITGIIYPLFVNGTAGCGVTPWSGEGAQP